MQICHFLNVTASPAREVLWHAIFGDTVHAPARYVGDVQCDARPSCLPSLQRLQRQRLVALSMSTLSDMDGCDRGIVALRLLLASQHLAPAVLMAPCAHKNASGLSETEVLDALPAQLHVPAMRGYCGAGRDGWELRDSGSFSHMFEISSQLNAMLACVPPVASAVLRASYDATRDGVLELASGIARAQHLASLSVSNVRAPVLACALRSWSALSTLTSLKLPYDSARVECYDLSRLAPPLAALQRLECLHIGTINWFGTYEGADVLAGAISTLIRLRELDVQGICVEEPNAVHALWAAATALPQLLSFAGPRQDESVWPTDIAPHLVACASLTSLMLSEHALGDTCGAATVAVITWLPQLRRLDLNGVDVAAFQLLAPALAVLVDLTALEVERCFIGVDSGAEVAPLARELAQLCHLRDLRIYAQLGDTGVVAFADGIAQLTALTSLLLCGVTSKCAGARALAKCVSGLTALQSLDLKSHASMEDSGAAALLSQVSALTALTALLLCYVGTGHGVSAAALGASLRLLQSLRVLRISVSAPGDAGMRELASSLESLTLLTELKLDFVAIPLAGGETLGLQLARMRTLQKLDLSGNVDLGDEGTAALVPHLASLTALTELSVQACGVECDSVAALDKYVLPLPHLRVLSAGGGWARSGDRGFEVHQSAEAAKQLCHCALSEDRMCRLELK